MKKMRILALFVIIFSITSCSVLDRSAKITYNEEELSLGDITEMRNEFSEDAENPRNIVVETYSAESVSEPVYWLENGNVWHTSLTCGYIRNGSRVICGSEENALAEGKEKLCSGCEKE